MTKRTRRKNDAALKARIALALPRLDPFVDVEKAATRG